MDVFWNPYYHDKIFEEDVPLTLDEWLAIGNTFAMILLAIAVLASIAVLTGLIRYHFSWRIRNWLLISNTMHQKLSGQILKEEYLMQLCGIIGVVVDFVHLDRKEECPDAEDLLDLPPARYVDPFRAPSNIYEQANEKDEDCKTFRNNEPDVFGKTNDGDNVKTARTKTGKPKPPKSVAAAPNSARPSECGKNGDKPVEEKKLEEEKKSLVQEKTSMAPTEKSVAPADDKTSMAPTEEKKPMAP